MYNSRKLKNPSDKNMGLTLEQKAKSQRLLRLKKKGTDIESMCVGLNISNFDDLVKYSDEISRLEPILKLVKAYKKTMCKLIDAGDLRLLAEEPTNDTVEPNMALYEELRGKYPDNTATKQFKFEHESKSQFKKYVYQNNTDIMRFHMSQANVLAIERLRNEIDISNYSPAQIHHDRMSGRDKNSAKIKIAEITKIQDTQYAKEDTAPEKQVKKKIIKKIIVKELESEHDSDSDCDVDELIEKYENKSKTCIDKDKHITSVDMGDYKKQLRTKFKKQIIYDFEMDMGSYIDDDDDDDDEKKQFERMIESYMGSSKRDRGALGKWSNRNPASLRKCVASVMKSLLKVYEQGE
jgi:hypothetical protein